MTTYLFWILAVLITICATLVVYLRNPVANALAMIGCFVGLAAVYIGLSAFVAGVMQVLVYSGAIMVLFIFIIMLLDLNKDKNEKITLRAVTVGTVFVLVFFIQMVAIFGILGKRKFPILEKEQLKQAAFSYKQGSKIATELHNGKLPDALITGNKLFSEYNLPLQVAGIILLIATIGVVVLAKKEKQSNLEGV